MSIAVVAGEATLLRTWVCIFSVAGLAIAGEVMTAGAMRKIGDLGRIKEQSGMPGAIRAVLTSPLFVIGVLAMALNFFALLFTLSIVDVSLAAPATASLTYIGNAIAAKIFLHENVTKRRWIGVLFVVFGVILLAK